MKINPIVNNYKVYVEHTLETNLNRTLERLKDNKPVSQEVVSNLLELGKARFPEICQKIREYYENNENNTRQRFKSMV